MTTQETLEQAMLSRKSVKIFYNRLGKITADEIGHAHVVLISSSLGKKTVTVDLSRNNHAMLGWKSFDLSNISRVEILN